MGGGVSASGPMRKVGGEGGCLAKRGRYLISKGGGGGGGEGGYNPPNPPVLYPPMGLPLEKNYKYMDVYQIESS